MTPFDWDHDGSVVLRQQPATAVQGDEAGDVWIRQEGQDGADQFIGVRRENVIGLCKAMLSAACLPLEITERKYEDVEIVGRHGNKMRIPASDFEKIDRIAAEMRLEEIAEQTRWTRPKPRQPKDRTAADRKRKQRQRKAAKRDAVTDSSRRDSVTTVTPRDSAPTAPRLPAELDLLQHGGLKQPAG